MEFWGALWATYSEKADEAARLEEQSQMSAYSMQEELKFLRVSPSQGTPFRMLDAGCGSGVLSRYLSEHFMGTSIDACDFLEHRIRQAKTLCQLPSHHKIHFFTSALEQLSVPDESYDLVICRYVYEHLANHSKVTSEFFRVLKPGGTVYLIHFDGIIFNLYHQNKRLGRLISKFKANLGLDLFIGRKMPGLLCAAQFQEVQWTVEAISFQGLKSSE